MSSSVIQLQDAPAFEARVIRAVAVGAAAGVLHAGFARAGAYVPTWHLAPAAALLAFSLHRGLGRWPLGIGGLFVVAVLFSLQLGSVWAAAGIGAASGVGIAALRHLERARAGASVLPGGLQWALAGLAGAALAVLGDAVARPLYLRLDALGAPPLLASVLAVAAAGLFSGLAAFPVYLRLKEDPVLQRADELLPELEGRLKVLVSRTVEQYRDCAQVLSTLPPEPSRSELSRVLVALARGTLEHAAEWSRVEAQLADPEAATHGREAERLRAEAAACADPVARGHLRVAAEAHQEEAARFATLQEQRGRALARVEAELALLSRARGTLVGARSGQVQLRSAELAGLSRKLGALTELQRLDAAALTQAAVCAELDQLAAAAEDRGFRSKPH